MGFLQDFDDLQRRAAAQPGEARVDAVRELGVLVELELTVTVAGEAPYPVVHRRPLAGLDPLAPGMTVAVRVDPGDRSSLTIG